MKQKQALNKFLTTRVDFRVHENDGSFTLVETKGFETPDYKINYYGLIDPETADLSEYMDKYLQDYFDDMAAGYDNEWTIPWQTWATLGLLQFRDLILVWAGNSLPSILFARATRCLRWLKAIPISKSIAVWWKKSNFEWTLSSFLFQGKATRFEPPTLESTTLQLRKILELIAFGSLVANKDSYSTVYAKVSKTWNAGDLLRELEDVNPEFYPVPVIQVASTIPGAFMEHKKRDPVDYLTKDDLHPSRCSPIVWNNFR
jgi:hypothetical protein